MKYLVTPEFSKKLAAIDVVNKIDVSRILGMIDNMSSDELSKPTSGGFLTELGENIFVLNMGDVRVVVTTVSSDDQTELLLLDIIEHNRVPSGGVFYANRDPRTNSKFNPRFNSSINPLLNSSINPRFNSSINPRFNSSINPRFNSSINPRFNSSINPRFNSSINPRFNSSINPRFNSSINPRMNRAYGGPFLYDLNLKQIGFVVRANDNVILIFELEASLETIGIKNAIEGYTLFDENNVWTGQLVKANDDVFIVFDLENAQTGIMV